MRFESWIVLVAMVGTAFMPSHVLGDGPRLDCTPTLTVSTIGGLAPSEVAPPDGSTPNDEVEIAWEASHVGADCATALDAPPVLVAPWVTPDVGPASDFAMFVTYADPDNDPPVSVSLRMDDRAVQAMVPLDPADTEYRDGAVFVGGDAPDFSDGGNQMAAGPHVTRFYAHNGHAAAEPASIDAPFVVLTASGAVRAPNPTNRFVIHPIANGPTLVPPVEVLPPLAQLAGDPANGIYSYTFELGPLAGRGGLEYTVSSGGPSLLDGHLEGPLGDGFDVHGAAHASPDARTGDQAVELSAPGATSEDGVHGTLHAYPTPGYALVQIGGLSMWQRGDAVPGPAALRVGLLADLTREATADACLVTSFQPSSDGAWTRHEVGLADEFTVFEADCRTSGPLSRTATLSELHNDPAFGLAAFLRFEVALVEPGGAAWPADATVALDDLGLVASVSNTAADMDACIYRAEPGAPLSTFTPVECQSDIGPNGALIPAGSTHANVWAHQMVPVLGEDLLPRRTYLEPAGFAFSYKSVVPYDVAFPVVALPPPPTAGRVEFGEDVNGDGTLGLGEPLLGAGDGVPDSSSPRTVGPFGISLAGRPDGVYAFAARYVTGRGAVADGAMALQRFVNDVPTAGLSASTYAGKKRIEFHLAVQDADDAQGDVAQALGGLRAWHISFGDGTSEAGEAPLPACLVHRYQRQGAYEAVLTVTDARQATGEARVVVESGETDDGSCV